MTSSHFTTPQSEDYSMLVNKPQLAKSIFEDLKEDDITAFETNFGHAYGVAIAQHHLSPHQAGRLLIHVKRLTKTLLQEHARETEKRPRSPEYSHKFRRPIPLLDYEESLAGLC